MRSNITLFTTRCVNKNRTSFSLDQRHWVVFGAHELVGGSFPAVCAGARSVSGLGVKRVPNFGSVLFKEAQQGLADADGLFRAGHGDVQGVVGVFAGTYKIVVDHHVVVLRPFGLVGGD